ncbi:Copia protein [Gossypium australe]|uniref:Copia protein n=1 Tax=Gossypium australe TaxID=47621 RepID=A0A5B6VI44_9ROSI|nr:Copia protein [Gossypium australe]
MVNLKELMKEKELKLTGFIDNNWVGSVEDMKSTSSWSSRKEENIAQSTSEAEYITAIAVAS